MASSGVRGGTVFTFFQTTRSALIVIDSSGSDDDENRPTKACKKKKISALDGKAERVKNLADQLQAKHGDTFNRIQYKLWAAALDVKKHNSMELPPPGAIWGGTSKESK